MSLHTSAPPTSPVASRPRLRWWVEVVFVLTFYLVYSGIRNIFGSASVSPQEALNNATDVIRLEQAIGLFHEQRIQAFFLNWGWFMRLWNIFYGSLHFVVTIFAMVWLYRRHPERYTRYRNALAVTTGVALAGFSLFPLMPPRLLDDCTTAFGGCSPHGFVDSLSHFGGLWSFDSGTMQSVSNQYAAMPSLHFAWASWCALALVPVLTRRLARGLLLLYPWLTLFAVVVTANHYWLDAAGGLFALATGVVLGGAVTRLENRLRFARLVRHAPARGERDELVDEVQPESATPLGSPTPLT
jgi:PAP2 superfamily